MRKDKKKISKQKLELFFPYYVNQGRLLDVYAILNKGYSEYSEITTSTNENNKTNTDAHLKGEVGFKLLSIGANSNVGGKFGLARSYSQDTCNTLNEKKVQTLTSIFSIVKQELEENGLITEISKAKPGQFVNIPVVLSLNSITSLLEEVSDLFNLTNSINKINKKPQIANAENFAEMKEFLKVMCLGDEVFYNTDNYAIIGTIVDDNLYQAVRSDILNSDMRCFAQVKKVYPKGTELMKNTIFSKLKDKRTKETFINAIKDVADSDTYEFEATILASITDKPVYELEIIALYQ